LKNWISTFVASGLLILAAGIVSESQAGEAEKGLKFGGSIRGRFEHINYLTDASGSTKDTRSRLRYRLRFDAKATINPHSRFYGRLVSGTDSRSGNATLGDPVDFGPTEITIRYAALVLTPWANGMLPSGNGKWAFDFGRVKNPYTWKGHGKDIMLWDNDIALAGTGTQFSHKLGDESFFFANTGYYQIDENSKSADKDAYMTPFQLGALFGGEGTSFGIRGSYFYMADLNEEFIQRGVDGTYGGEDGNEYDGVTSSAGNVPDGLTGDTSGGKLNVVETQAYLSTGLGSVPVTAFGGYSNNNSAQASEMYTDVGKNSVAYNFGIEAGSKKKALLAGLAWYHIEANSFPSQFIDSDLLDGTTNREGLFLYLGKTVMKNTDLGLHFFRSDAIDKSPDLGESVENSKRNRLQIDLLYKF
jgi:hypothetical protein